MGKNKKPDHTKTPSYPRPAGTQQASPTGLTAPVSFPPDAPYPPSNDRAPQHRAVMLDFIQFGPNQQPSVCPRCGATCITSTRQRSSLLTWLCCGFLWIIPGLQCGCCFIPFCWGSCDDLEHYCPNCHQLLGIYKRL